MKTANSVKQLLTGTSTSVMTLGAATSGCRTLATAIAAVGSALTVGSTGISFRAEDDAGNWLNGKCTLTATGQVTRTSISSSSNGAGDVTLAGTVRTFALVIDDSDLNALMSASDGIAPAALNDAGALQASDIIVITRGGVEFRSSFSALATLLGAPADTTAPTLTAATGTQTGATTATVSVSTNEGNGTLYCLITTSSTATDAAIKAGLSQVVTSAGTKTFSITALTAATQYYAHFIHADANNNTSTAVHSAAFTTAASAAIPSTMAAPVITAGDGQISIAWTMPTLNNGAFLDATFTASTGQTVTATSSPATMAVPNGTAVTVTGKARNTVGPAANASPASNSVTPAAVPSAPAYLFAPAPYEMPAAGNISNTGYYQPGGAIYIKTAAGAVPAGVNWMWSKSSTVAPCTYLQGGGDVAHQNDRKEAGHTGNWNNGETGNQYYGLFGTSGVYAWGTPGTWYLWAVTSDGFAKPFDNNTGTPVGFTLT